MGCHTRSVGRIRSLAAILVVVMLCADAVVLAGCAGDADEGAAHPFGPPPEASPRVHAWAAGEVGGLLVTTDGGATWSRQRFYLSQRAVDVAFPDVVTGWLVTEGGTVLATTDGGAEWTVVKQTGLAVTALAASSADRAWVLGSGAGAAGGDVSVVLRTADGGATWRRTGFGTAQLTDLAFADDRHGLLVALDRIWSTSDGGRVWKLRRTWPMTVLTSVTMTDSRRAWVAGWDTQTGDPLVFTSRDGGTTWRALRLRVSPAEPGALQARQIAAVAGRLWVTCPAGVLASRDGGRSWELQQVPAGRPVAIAAADEAHVLATTETQPILASADGGQAWLAFGRADFLEHPLVAEAAVAAPAQ